MPTSHYLEIDDRLGFVEVAGVGRDVLCIHTAGQSGVQYREVIRSAAGGQELAGHRVVVPDLPGHGRSEPALTGPVSSLEYYARWLVEVIDRLELVRPFVVGCSIGGRIALELATRIPDRLSGVIAMAADGSNHAESGAAFARGLEDAGSPSRTDRTYYGTLAACGSRVDAARAEMIATMHRREDPAVSLSDLIGWATHDVTPRLSQVTCPVHLVAGEEDFWVDAGDIRAVADQIPGARFTLLEGIGHYPMEELSAFPRTLEQWLRELRSDR